MDPRFRIAIYDKVGPLKGAEFIQSSAVRNPVSSGVYLYWLKAGNQRIAKKMILLK